MARKAFIILLILAAFSESRAQQLSFMFSAGMGGYSMKDMKTLNSDLQAHLPFPTQVTSNFPMTPLLGCQFTVRVSYMYTLGILYSFNSTGSRIASSDYSGSYHFDNVLSGHTLGLITDINIWEGKAFGINFQANLGAVITRIRMTEDLNMADTLVSTSEKYHSLSGFLEPRLMATYRWKFLKTGVYCGYFYNPGAEIQDSDGKKLGVKANWSGIRFGILIGIQKGEVSKPARYYRQDPDNE
jgi:hypothetical protein